MQSDVGLASPLLRRCVSALDGRPESGSSTLLSEAGRSKGAGAVLWLASSLPCCCLSNCGREIAALAEIKTGHPLKGVALVQLELRRPVYEAGGFFFATIVDSLELFTVSYAIKGVALTLRW